MTGAAVQWLRDGLGLIDGARPRSVRWRPVGARHRRRRSSCPPSPAWAARGGIRTPAAPSSASPGATTRAHLARAVVEAMAYQTRDVVEAMAAGRRPRRARSCGSTAVPRRWTCCCSSRPTSSACTVGRPVDQETTALGAAYLAGLAEGVWGSLDDVAARVAAGRRVRARPSTADAADPVHQTGSAPSSARGAGPAPERAGRHLRSTGHVTGAGRPSPAGRRRRWPR